MASYVLVTPVRDEIATIGRTIDAVVRQSLHPVEWVIVSGGSTDGTNEFVERAAAAHPWIRLLPVAAPAERSFAAVVHNTEAGVRALAHHDSDYIGLLDGDLDFHANYFERLIARFDANPRLGLAGGVVIDPGSPKDRLPRNRSDVPGAVQFFRRECFARLGGLIPVPEGGWDTLTCAMARRAGFETELVVDLFVDHLKPRNVSQGRPLQRLWQLGVRDYAVGYDAFFEFLKCVSRIGEPPFGMSAVSRWLGFCAAAVQRRPRVVPRDVIEFVRSEQRARVRTFLRLGHARERQFA